MLHSKLNMVYITKKNLIWKKDGRFIYALMLYISIILLLSLLSLLTTYPSIFVGQIYTCKILNQML